jgi:hypothetical protein
MFWGHKTIFLSFKMFNFVPIFSARGGGTFLPSHPKLAQFQSL